MVRLAAEEGVTFDTCPLSNVGLGVFPDIASHPLRALMQAGVNCTVSTDDPLCFANTLNEEYAALAAEGGFTRAELAQVARNGWRVADVREERAARVARGDRQDRRSVSTPRSHAVPQDARRARADKALAAAYPEHSRVAFQRSFDAGRVTRGGAPLERSSTVRPAT